jgi:hypothetical protein
MPDPRSRRHRKAKQPRTKAVPQRAIPSPPETEPAPSQAIVPPDPNGTLAITLLGVVVVLLALLVIAIAMSL